MMNNQPTLNTTPVTEIPNWHAYWMQIAHVAATRSKDPSTKVGCVIVEPSTQHVISIGYNGMIRKIQELPSRWERPEKYTWVRHAEENAIALAARNGNKTDGAFAYITHPPCSARCTGMLIQAGIIQVIVQHGVSTVGNNSEEVLADYRKSRQIFMEAGVDYWHINKEGHKVV